MAATGKGEKTPLLVRLYTSLRFWGGLLLLFYLTFFIINFAFGRGVYSFVAAGLALALMPLMDYIFIRGGLPDLLGYPLVQLILPVIVIWALELGSIAWLKFKAAKLEKRTIIIIGSAVLLLLMTQFVGCTIFSIGGF